MVRTGVGGGGGGDSRKSENRAATRRPVVFNTYVTMFADVTKTMYVGKAYDNVQYANDMPTTDGLGAKTSYKRRSAAPDETSRRNACTQVYTYSRLSV